MSEIEVKITKQGISTNVLGHALIRNIGEQRFAFATDKPHVVKAHQNSIDAIRTELKLYGINPDELIEALTQKQNG